MHSVRRMQARRELQQLVRSASPDDGVQRRRSWLDNYYEKAIGMLQSPKLREAFNLSAEPEVMREAMAAPVRPKLSLADGS